MGGVANAGIRGASATNPLAGMRWGVYRGPLDGMYPAWRAARGRDRALLAKIALRPSAHWFGAWDDDATAASLAQDYIYASTRGRPNVLTQVAVFRLDPWEEAACSQLPDLEQQASYDTWIDNFAAGIGASRVALILQPDLPFASCAPGGSLLPLQMVAFAARVFSALPHTTVYIDGGARDWEPVSKAVWLLSNAGVAYTRGFALNDTHYDGTGAELMFGAAVVRGLARAHIPEMHFVINTAENGAPFQRSNYHGNKLNPAVCPNRHAHVCVTLGIPPTWDTAAAQWKLSRREQKVAATLADAYLWIGRPWLDDASYPFDLKRALGLAASTPF
ncbi:MAG: glycoside hydrolase family 6 protein [Solirubrobacteraceae bacterium]